MEGSTNYSNINSEILKCDFCHSEIDVTPVLKKDTILYRCKICKDIDDTYFFDTKNKIYLSDTDLQNEFNNLHNYKKKK
jgi:hypothetical protein